MRNTIYLVAVLLLLPGCAIGPDYVRPHVDQPAAWRIQYEAAADVVNISWWEQFGDPTLNSLIETALRENKDIRIAAARVDQFLGLLGTTRSRFFPQFGYDAFAQRQQTTENGPVPLGPGMDTTFNTFQATLGVGWEIDLWGQIRRATESAQAQVLASEEGRRGIILTLVTNMANGYVTLRALDRQLDIARKTEQSYAEALRIFRLRYKYGTISRLELSQIESQYEIARQAIPEIESLIAQQENLLSVLLGRNPGPIPRGGTIDALTIPGIPGGLPSSLLEQRPDILRAEQELIASNAEIGAAKALYFPTISLTGSYGGSSAELSDLFDSPSRIWSIGGDLLGPLFSFGAISGQVKQAEALQQQALYRYEQTVQNSFREVDDALVSTTKGREQLAAQENQVKALKEYARVARLQYEGGMTSYLEVQIAEQTLFGAELSSVQTRANVYTSLVNVYKAMGGGWVVEADKMTLSPMASGRPSGPSLIESNDSTAEPGAENRQ